MHDDLRRADEAKRILDNPLWQETFSTIKSGITDAMGRSAMGDVDTHNKLVIALQMLNQIKVRLENYLTTGKLVEIEFERQKVVKIRKA